MKLALVSGANGYIGSALCQHLHAQGWRVRALLRKPLDGPWDEYACHDLATDSVPETLLSDVDTIFHLAASADSTPATISLLDRKVNIEGTEKLLNASKLAGTRKFIYVSTVKAMGEGGEECLDERSPNQPASSYGLSKLAAEHLVLNQQAVAACVLRLPIVYGGDNQGNLPKMVRAILSRRFPPLVETHNKRSMVHVDDVAQAAILAAKKDISNGNIYLVTDGQPYSTRQIYDWVCSISGTPSPNWNIPLVLLKVLARIGDIGEGIVKKRFPFNSDVIQKLTGSAWYSNEKIKRELAFQPQHHLNESLPAIIAAVSGRANKAE